MQRSFFPRVALAGPPALLLSLLLAACSDGMSPPGGADPMFLAVSGGGFSSLYRVDATASGLDTEIAPVRTSTGQSLGLTDMAVCPDGRAYANNFGTLYSLDTLTARVTSIGGLQASGVNSLACSGSGALYAGGGNSLYLVDPITGAGTRMGGNSIGSYSGDIVFAPDGTLYGTLTAPGASDLLVRIDPATGQAERVHPQNAIGYPAVFGLAIVANRLYGVTDGGQLITIDRTTGQGTLIRELSFRAYGAVRAESDQY